VKLGRLLAARHGNGHLDQRLLQLGIGQAGVGAQQPQRRGGVDQLIDALLAVRGRLCICEQIGDRDLKNLGDGL